MEFKLGKEGSKDMGGGTGKLNCWMWYMSIRLEREAKF